MLTLRKGILFQQLVEELQLVYSPDEVTMVSLNKALNDENISIGEFNFLEQNHFNYVVVGESEIFASRNGELFTEFQASDLL